MTCRVNHKQTPPDRQTRAMTLVEMLGVLTVIAILAVVALPVAIRILDRIALDKETATLRALADSLQDCVMRRRFVPGAAGWHFFIATNAGWDLASVTNNIRNHRRVLVVNAGSGWLSTNLPYSQTSAGTPTPPDNARMILLSSISDDLPLNSGMSANFDTLWNAADGTFPTAGMPWSSWTGRGEDVRMQRIDLGPLFVRALLSTFTPGTNGLGHYGFDGTTPIATADYDGFSAFFLRGTELNLRSGPNIATPPDHTVVLQQDTSYVFENNVWQTSIVGPTPAPGIGNLTNIVDAFLNATPNINAYYYTNTAPYTQQVLVVQTMRHYMSNYTRWASSNFTTAAKNSLMLESNRVFMMKAIQGLYSEASGWTNSPPPNYVP